MLSKELEFCLNGAFKEARDTRQEFITVEHLLLALLDVPHGERKSLKACGAELDDLTRGAAQLHREDHAAAGPSRRPRTCSPRWASSGCCNGPCFHVQSSGEQGSDRRSTCWSPCSAKRSRMRSIFLPAGDYPAGCRQLHLARNRQGSGESEERRWTATREAEPKATQEPPALEQFTRNLNQLARRGQDRSAGRTRNELARTVQILVPSAQEQSALRR